MYRKRPFATYGQERLPTRGAVCRIPCRILCLADVHGQARRVSGSDVRLQIQFIHRLFEVAAFPPPTDAQPIIAPTSGRRRTRPPSTAAYRRLGAVQAISHPKDGTQGSLKGGGTHRGVSEFQVYGTAARSSRPRNGAGAPDTKTSPAARSLIDPWLRTLSSVALASTIGAAICPGITDAFRMGNCPVAAGMPPEIHRVRYVLQEATRVVGVVNLVIAIRLGIRVQDESLHFL